MEADNKSLDYGEASFLLSQAKDWTKEIVLSNASCVLECSRVVLASPSVGHEEQLDCLKWLACLVEYVPVFEWQGDLVDPFLGSVEKYLDEVCELFDEVTEGNKNELIDLVNILLSLTIEVISFVSKQDRFRLSDVPSLVKLLPLIQQKILSKFDKLILVNTLELSPRADKQSRFQKMNEKLKCLSDVSPLPMRFTEKEDEDQDLSPPLPAGVYF